MSVVEINSKLKIFHQVHGKGEPLILINGLKSDHTGWMPILEELKERFKVVIFDNRAVGQTKDSGESFSIEDMANDIVSLMDYLNISSAHIGGHSMGGAIAQVLAHQHGHRVRSLVLCNTFIKFNALAAKAFENVLTLFQSGASRRDIMKAVIPWVFSESTNTPELRGQIFDFVDTDPYWQTTHDYQRQLNALNEFDSSEWVDKIMVSTVVVGSSEDITALPEESKEIVKKIKGATLKILPGGHASAIEQPAELLKIFMERI